MPTLTEKIRDLNDELRRHLLSGGAVITPGVAALGQEALDRIVQTIAVFDDFCEANNPYEEHDFEAFEVEGKTIFFKIDLYEEPDVKDSNGEPVVNRVLTIMLADEY
jgi:Protein of unknown function (DUF3768)